MFAYYFYYIWVLIPPVLFAIYAQIKVKSAYAKYSRIGNKRGVSGSELAQAILYANGIQDVEIEETRGMLSDHYDPSARVLRLSPQVYQGRSVASIGIAAHEAGHAIQHYARYAPMALRSFSVPLATFGSNFAFLIFFVGLIFGKNPILLNIGIGLFAGVVFFSIVTLPVEFNASRRAIASLTSEGIIDSEEEKGVRAVLSAAAMTYVAAALMALAHLIRMILISRD